MPQGGSRTARLSPERHAKGLEVLLAAAHFVGFARSQFEKVARSLGFAHQIKRFVVVLENRPVGVVFADWRVDLEPARELDEELDVLPLVELLREFALDLGFVNDILVDRMF